MRERKSFIERTKVKFNDNTNVKYFLLFEGEKTEEIYFDAIIKYKDNLGISPIIELIPLVRDYGEEGWSNPKKIVDRLVENVAESEGKYITYEVLLNRIMEYIKETHRLKPLQHKIIWNTLEQYCQNNYQQYKYLDVDNVEEAVKEFMNVLSIKNVLTIENIPDNIARIIEDLSMTYDKEIDHICVIVDRDRNSFVTEQYKSVIDSCEKHHFDLYVTNPCFEFWLLLHFDGCEKLDKSKLLNNSKIKGRTRYTESELSKKMSFSKNNYDADKVVLNLQKAIDNEKNFCEELSSLENEVGSNLGNLFNGIMDK